MRFINLRLFKNILILLVGIASLFLSACTPYLGGDDYDVSSVGEISTALKGVVSSKRTVMLRPDDANQPSAGALAGTVGGAVVGSTIGGGHKMPLVSTIVGGIAGGAAGHAIEQKISEQQGVAYQIKLDGGKLINITQGLNPKLSVGQKVLVIKSNRGRSRVIADNTD